MQNCSHRVLRTKELEQNTFDYTDRLKKLQSYSEKENSAKGNDLLLLLFLLSNLDPQQFLSASSSAQAPCLDQIS